MPDDAKIKTPVKDNAGRSLTVGRVLRVLDSANEGRKADSPAFRQPLTRALKTLHTEALELARQRLEKTPRRGLASARVLSTAHDTIIRGLYEFLTTRIFPASGLTRAERLSIAAIGGYGRGTLAPGSDLDILFLCPYKQTSWGESIVEIMLYILWDTGLKVGHATRTADDCIRLSRKDTTICTTLLEARFLCGDKALFEDMTARFEHDIAGTDAAAFVEHKLAERDRRHNRTGISRYLVEPNVKDGKGGLRDLHTLFWMVRYCYGVQKTPALARVGLLSEPEYALFRRCEDFLWAVRCHLHFLAGRAEERLTFDMQATLAHRMGYTSHGGLRDVERFMKQYFLTSREVGNLTRIFCALLEEGHKKPKPALKRLVSALRRQRTIQGFVTDHGRLTVASPSVFEDNPVNLIRLFHVADVHDLMIHPNALKLVTHSLHLIGPALRRDETANRLFLDMLTSRQNPERALRRMSEAGVLGRFVPDFGRIVAQMQFNMYHHYTVDEHLLCAIGQMAALEKDELADEHPLVHDVVKNLNRQRAILYLAIFLHDIAKGRDEDHSEAGTRVALQIAKRLGFSAADARMTAWLVRHHLLMSDTAQTRDLSDPKTITDFVTDVYSLDQLKLLLVLTIVDIRAVGPGVWNGWKGQLLRQLYEAARQRLAGGDGEDSRHKTVLHKQTRLSERLDDWPKSRVANWLRQHSAAYWTGLDSNVHEHHARMAAETSKQDSPLEVRARPDSFRAATEVTLYTADHPGLFSRLAGACAMMGLAIVDARIFTTRDGMALDTFWVQDPEHGAISEKRRLGRLEGNIRRAFAGDIRRPDITAGRVREKRRLSAFSIESRVILDNEASDHCTVIKVSGLDRPGLLYDLANTLFELGLVILSAHISTFGERAVDVFYVTDMLNQKITSQARQRKVERRLLEALSGAAKKQKAQVSIAPGHKAADEKPSTRQRRHPAFSP